MFLRRLFSVWVLISFLFTLVIPIPQANAQPLLGLPEPGIMVNLTTAYEPVLIKGLKVHPEDPFKFDFIIDTGSDVSLQSKSGFIASEAKQSLKEQSSKLIKYFFASLTIPEKDLWVNLSPYEKDRMIAPNLGQTEMGRDMLAQDYILKQLTASLIYPEKGLGKEFWQRIYEQAQKRFGMTQIPVNTFNKVWIVADKADVFERASVAYVVGAHLKVMLEEDYLALQKHSVIARSPQGDEAISKRTTNDTHTLSSQIIRQIILPAIEKEVNTGKNFVPLRQMFYSMILASWYKMALKDALITQIYGNQSKVKVGVNQSDPKVNEEIFNRYLQAYKKGVFNYIKEDLNASTKEPMPRKYFSGGLAINVEGAEKFLNSIPDGAQLSTGDLALVTVNTAFKKEPKKDAAMKGDNTSSLLSSVSVAPGISLKIPYGDGMINYQQLMFLRRSQGDTHPHDLRNLMWGGDPEIPYDPLQSSTEDFLEKYLESPPKSIGPFIPKEVELSIYSMYSKRFSQLKTLDDFEKAFQDLKRKVKEIETNESNKESPNYKELFKIGIFQILSIDSYSDLPKIFPLIQYSKNGDVYDVNEDKFRHIINEKYNLIANLSYYKDLNVMKQFKLTLERLFPLIAKPIAERTAFDREPQATRSDFENFVSLLIDWNPDFIYGSRKERGEMQDLLKAFQNNIRRLAIFKRTHPREDITKDPELKFKELWASIHQDLEKLIKIHHRNIETIDVVLTYREMLRQLAHHTSHLGPLAKELRFLRHFQRAASKAASLLPGRARRAARRAAIENSAPKPPEEGSDHAQLITRGGIDLNSMNMQINRQGNGVQMHFDRAMIEQIKRQGFDGLDFQIQKIVPVANLSLLLGLDP